MIRLLNTYKLSYLLFVLFASSCASSYITPDLPSLKYGKTVKTENIEYALAKDVLVDSENKKYASIELKSAYSLYAIKVTNISKDTLKAIPKNIEAFKDEDITILESTDKIYNALKQTKGKFFLWLIPLPIPVDEEPDPQTGEETVTVWPLPVGFPFFIYNFLKAKKANKKLKTDLEKNALLGKDLAPNAIFYGYVAISKRPDGALKLYIYKE